MFVRGCYAGTLDNFCKVYQVQPVYEKKCSVQSVLLAENVCHSGTNGSWKGMTLSILFLIQQRS